VTLPDPSEPVPPGAEPRGVGESLDAPGSDVPAVDDLPPGERPIGESPAELTPTPPRSPEVIEVIEVIEVVTLAPADPQQVTMRRAPRYRAFIGTGAVVGAVFAVVLVGVFPDDGHFSTGAVLGYLGVALALLGALLGGAVAVLLERPRRR